MRIHPLSPASRATRHATRPAAADADERARAAWRLMAESCTSPRPEIDHDVQKEKRAPWRKPLDYAWQNYRAGAKTERIAAIFLEIVSEVRSWGRRIATTARAAYRYETEKECRANVLQLIAEQEPTSENLRRARVASIDHMLALEELVATYDARLSEMDRLSLGGVAA